MWFGWAQEAPVGRLQKLLILGSIVALLIPIGAGVLGTVGGSRGGSP